MALDVVDQQQRTLEQHFPGPGGKGFITPSVRKVMPAYEEAAVGR